jgi:Right handed beta helix region
MVLQGALGVEGNSVSAGVRTDGANSGYRVDHNLIRLNGLGVDFGSTDAEESRVDHNCLRDNEYGLASQTSDLVGARVDHNDLFRHGNAFEIGWGYHTTVDTSFDHNHTQAGGFWTYRLENTRGVTLSHNSIDASTSTFAIALYGGNTAPMIVGNDVSGPSGSGIQFLVPTPEVPAQSTGAYVAANTVTAVGATPGTGIGIGVASTPDGVGALVGGVITGNRVSDGAGVGISIRPNTGLTVSRNVVERNGTYGIYARPGTTGVLFDRNQMHDNQILDAIDEGTGNLWLHNGCVTDSPAGTICGTR